MNGATYIHVIHEKTGITYLLVHGLVLCLEGENVLGALSPSLAIVGVDMAEYVSDPRLEVGDGIAVGIEISGSVPLPVKVAAALQGVVAVDGDQEFDAVTVGLYHETIQAFEDRVIPRVWTVALQAVEGIDVSSLLICVLT